MAMNHSDHTNGPLVDLEIHGVGKPPEQASAQGPSDHGKAFGLLTEWFEGLIDRDQKAKCRRGGLFSVPFERTLDVILRRLSEAQGTHLSNPLGKPIAHRFPGFPGL